jgi:hypothetical protein
MNLHPYDNIERRYRHTDIPNIDGLAVVARLLHLSGPPAGDEVLYDLSFFSGGIGVLDRLAISLPAGPILWERVRNALRAKTPEELGGDVATAEELRWLLCDDEQWDSPRQAAIRFINQERRTFQDECHPESRILFMESSDVNDWQALWGDDLQLNYLGYSQG